jgi:transposase
MENKNSLKEKEYLISFGDVFISAKNDKDAEEKALKLIKEGNVQINFIEEQEK